MPSGKGGKKLTKADKEKRKREEEERRRVEEEEERIRQEEEAKIRQKQEKIEAEERKKQEKEELKIRAVQLQESRVIINGFCDTSKSFHDKRRSESRWNRYLQCDGSPDPTVPTEINTYVNVWKEDDKRVLIDEVLHDSTSCLKLIEELNFYLFDNPTLDAKCKTTHNQTIASLQQLIQEKINRSTYEILRRAVYMLDPETMNLEKFWKNDYCTLCLWGNLCKNPRIKSFDFTDLGISFDIPKALTKVSCAYRFLLTDFDHYSPCTRSYHAIVIREPEPEVEPVVEESKDEEVSDDKEQHEEADKEVEEPVEKEKTTDDLFRMQDLMAELNKLDDGDTTEEVEVEQEEEIVVETPVEDLRTSPVPSNFEDFDGEEDAIDMRSFQIIGPIMHFEILQLPTQPVEKKGWTIIQHSTPPDIQSFDYKPEMPKSVNGDGDADTADAANTEVPSSTLLSSSNLLSKDNEKKKPVEIENPPITVNYQLPKTIYYAEQPQVALWDSNTKEWRTNGVVVSDYDEANNLLTFKTGVFGVFTFLQDFHINMPFQSWELRPQGTKSCLLTIVASINEVSLLIRDHQVSVYLSESAEEEGVIAEESEGINALKPLVGQWMSVQQIIQKLRSVGINLFPREDSSKYVTIAEKSCIAEDMLYQEMAQLSTAVAFSWSRWNSESADRDKIIVQACEHLSPEPINEDAWSLYAFTRKKVQKLKMKEFDETFSNEIDTSIQFHADFYHVFGEIGSEEGNKRHSEVDFHYFDTVKELLQATRPVVFS